MCRVDYAQKACALKDYNYKSLGGKMFMEKKVCAFELCLVFIKIYTKSFGGKNLST